MVEVESERESEIEQGREKKSEMEAKGGREEGTNPRQPPLKATAVL